MPAPISGKWAASKWAGPPPTTGAPGPRSSRLHEVSGREMKVGPAPPCPPWSRHHPCEVAGHGNSLHPNLSRSTRSKFWPSERSVYRAESRGRGEETNQVTM
jgi:hypothetical protein